MNAEELQKMISKLWEIEDRALVLADDIKTVMRSLLKLHAEFQTERKKDDITGEM